MTRLRWWLALPAFLIATSGPSSAAEIKDKAGLFTDQAVKKAQSELERIEKEYSVPVRVETMDSLEGANIDDVLARHAKAENAHGLYILIAKKEHKTEVGASKSFSKYLTRSRTLAIREAINDQFKISKFDEGLVKGIDKIDSTLSEARAEAGGSLRPTAPATRRAGQAPVGGAVAAKPSHGGMAMWITIGLGILALFIVIRILGALFSGGNRGYAGQQRMMGPGMGPGGPGYGPGYGGGGGGGGGGFMSSMFGGIGGALAGNWLYDQFSGGRHHDTSIGQSTSYDQGAGTSDVPANDDFVTPGDGGGDWGGGGADAGGGGDWGGGGGGGDWGGGDAGGGGGGDWGGGGGDGGSW